MPQYYQTGANIYEAQLYQRGNTGLSRNPLEYPTTHADWVSRYSWLFDAYVGSPYSLQDIKGLHLFRALDEDGEVLAETRRLTRDIQHVVDTDAQALAGQEWTLDLDIEDDPTPEQSARLESAWRIWQRSRIQREKGRWARMGASMGDIVLEAVRVTGTRPYDVRIVAYDPRHVRLEYDAVSGTTLERVIVTIPYFDPPSVTPEGIVRDGAVLHHYQRVIDAEQITVTQDGVTVEEESGPHVLGTVPVVHLPFVPYVEPEHGLWAAVGLEHSLALIDSLMTQLQAVGNRYGNPMLAVIGAKIGTNSGDISKFGRIVSGIPQGGSVDYVEADLPAIRTLLEAARAEHESVRQTLPEFLFTDSGANSSGSALNFRAAAFSLKMNEIRGRWYAGIAELLEYAVALEQGREYDQDDSYLVVSAPPVLPVNQTEELANIHAVHERGGLRQRDYVAHLQRIGIVPALVDPAEYAEAVREEAEIRAELETLQAQRILGTQQAAAQAAIPEGIEVQGLGEPESEP